MPYSLDFQSKKTSIILSTKGYRSTKGFLYIDRLLCFEAEGLFLSLLFLEHQTICILVVRVSFYIHILMFLPIYDKLLHLKGSPLLSFTLYVFMRIGSLNNLINLVVDLHPFWIFQYIICLLYPKGISKLISSLKNVLLEISPLFSWSCASWSVNRWRNNNNILSSFILSW